VSINEALLHITLQLAHAICMVPLSKISEKKFDDGELLGGI
jgi:hypothetical protein